ncbi:MAG: UDP-N-acetylglucosamine diphosphorylase/glucosamine-1-phosphate N-acetyltransferase [unclassified Hahellaceae]|nr:UDP-N-acetylglucosamine diphosphorylase/glucosamine-1-phosphate N-acetyltransferase [Hahellaceae bacterium]|tara:strand:+ start:54637 stop:56031 length:1395 start_codon:yes stop_codon:yes gene_type:complete
MPLEVVILAAGQGSRMKSDQPKVLHGIAGKPLVEHVIDAALKIEPGHIHIVYGHKGEHVRQKLSTIPAADRLTYSEQAEQLGTGHAVAQALPRLNEVADDASQVLILYGDVPLIAADTLRNFVAASAGKLGILTVTLDNSSGYGRILRNDSHEIIGIVEEKDASPAQKTIKEVNTGIMCCSLDRLNQWLPKLSSNNAQGEYYLTDIVALAVADGVPVGSGEAASAMEVEGVNNRLQLAALERQFQRKEADRLMTEGCTLADPARVDVRGSVRTGRDCFADINVVFEGNVVLGDRVSIGPNCVLRDCTIGADTEILAFSTVESSKVGSRAVIGPYARLRPGCELASDTKIGNFVEVKKSVIGEGSKVNHLSYVGDSEIGKGVNVGAGTITCNYDGVNKFKTVLGDNVFIGSNTALVAPVTVGANATVGAGSVITHDVEADSLAVARGKQKKIDGWKRPAKKKPNT